MPTAVEVAIRRASEARRPNGRHLTPLAQLVAVLVASRMWGRCRQAWLAYATLAAQTGATTTAIVGAVRQLREAGVFEVQLRGQAKGRTRRCTVFTLPAEMQDSGTSPTGRDARNRNSEVQETGTSDMQKTGTEVSNREVPKRNPQAGRRRVRAAKAPVHPHCQPRTARPAAGGTKYLQTWAALREAEGLGPTEEGDADRLASLARQCGDEGWEVAWLLRAYLDAEDPHLRRHGWALRWLLVDFRLRAALADLDAERERRVEEAAERARDRAVAEEARRRAEFAASPEGQAQRKRASEAFKRLMAEKGWGPQMAM